MKFKITLVVFTISIIACTNTPPGWIKVDKFNEKISLIGFSISPPREGDNWHIVQKTEGEILFAGQNKSNNSSLVAIGMTLKLPPEIKTKDEFKRFFQNYRELYSNPKRFTILEHEEVVNRNESIFCLDYKLLSNDKKAYTQAGYKSLILSIYGKTCQHPDNHDYATDISYSERYEEGSDPTDLKERAEQFISSMNFERLNMP